MALSFNILVFITYLLACIKVINTSRYGYILLPFFYQGALLAPSLIYIENAGYISEQDRTGLFIGSVPLFCIFSFLTLIIIQQGVKLLIPYFRNTPVFTFKEKNIEHKILSVIIYLSLGLLFTNLILSPIPLFDETVDRFDFWESSYFPFLNKIFGSNSSFLAFGLGLYYLKGTKLKSITLIVLYLLYLILIGNKFSSLVISFFLIFLPIFICEKNFKIRASKLFNLKFIFAGLLLFGIVYYNYSIKNSYQHIVDNPFDAIVYRFLGLQGHVWWGASYNYVYLDKENTWAISELLYGMHHLMRELSPSEFVELSIERGVSFTNGYPSILLRIFPIPLALGAHILLVTLFCVPVTAIFISSLKNKSFLFSIVLSQLYIWTTYAFTMAYFYKIIPLILFITVYLIFYLSKGISKKHVLIY